MGTINNADRQNKQKQLLGDMNKNPFKIMQFEKGNFYYLAKISVKPPPYIPLSKNILSIVQNDLKNTSYLIYQWSPRSLFDLRQERIQKNHPLHPEQIWSLLYQTVLGYSEIHEKEVTNSNNPKIQLCINFDNIKLFQNDKVVKVVPPFIYDYENNNPNYKVLMSNQITVLGLIFLDLGLLQNVRDIYLGSNNLATYINRFEQRYPANLAIIIRKMIKGATWTEIQKKLQNEIGTKFSHMQDEFNQSFYPHKGELNTSFINNHKLYNVETLKTYYAKTSKDLQLQSRKNVEEQNNQRQMKTKQNQKFPQGNRQNTLENRVKTPGKIIKNIKQRSSSHLQLNKKHQNRSRSPTIIVNTSPLKKQNQMYYHSNNNNHLPLNNINFINAHNFVSEKPKIKFFYTTQNSPRYSHQNNNEYGTNYQHNPHKYQHSPIKQSYPTKKIQTIQSENYCFQISSKDKIINQNTSGIPVQHYICKTKPDYQSQSYQQQIDIPILKRQKTTSYFGVKEQFNDFINLPHQSRLSEEKYLWQKPHKQGVLKFRKQFQNGTAYDGEWVDGQMQGRGKFFYSTGNLMYDGQWKAGKYHGEGKLFNINPEHLDEFDFTDFSKLKSFWKYYEGQFEEGLMHGFGIIMIQNGQRFQGGFYQQKVNGNGTFYGKHEKIVRGIWKNNRLLEFIKY